MSQHKQRVLKILLMSFNILPTKANELAKDWLMKHPESSWHTLEELLASGKVIIKNRVLYDIPQLKEEEIKALVDHMSGANGVEIKDRWYRMQFYPKCFVGSEAIKWLMVRQKATKEEAIALGNILLDLGIIYHVTDEHDFKDDYLFYRFSSREVIGF